jgi:hypothetical protein
LDPGSTESSDPDSESGIGSRKAKRSIKKEELKGWNTVLESFRLLLYLIYPLQQ